METKKPDPEGYIQLLVLEAKHRLGQAVVETRDAGDMSFMADSLTNLLDGISGDVEELRSFVTGITDQALQELSATASPEDMDAYIVAGIISAKFDGLTVEEVAAQMTDSWGEDAEQRVLRALGRLKVISESDPSTRVLTSVGGVLRVAQRDPRDDESWTPR